METPKRHLDTRNLGEVHVVLISDVSDDGEPGTLFFMNESRFYEIPIFTDNGAKVTVESVNEMVNRRYGLEITIVEDRRFNPACSKGGKGAQIFISSSNPSPKTPNHHIHSFVVVSGMNTKAFDDTVINVPLYRTIITMSVKTQIAAAESGWALEQLEGRHDVWELPIVDDDNNYVPDAGYYMTDKTKRVLKGLEFIGLRYMKPLLLLFNSSFVEAEERNQRFAERSNPSKGKGKSFKGNVNAMDNSSKGKGKGKSFKGKGNSKDSAKDSAKGSANDSAKGSANDSAKGSAKDSAKGSANDSVNDSANDSVNDSAKDSANDKGNVKDNNANDNDNEGGDSNVSSPLSEFMTKKSDKRKQARAATLNTTSS